MPSLNMPLWHVDYPELKPPMKQQLQEGLSDLPFPKTTHKISQEKGVLTGPGREHSYYQRLGVNTEIYLSK